MTDTTDKIRALFLTAVMVGSLFGATVAFSGGVAAADSGTVTTPSSTVPEETNQSFTHTANLTLNNDQDLQFFRVDFSPDSPVNPDLGNVTESDLTVEGSAIDTPRTSPDDFTELSASNGVLTFKLQSSDTASDTQSVTLTVDNVTTQSVDSNTDFKFNVSYRNTANAQFDVNETTAGVDGTGYTIEDTDAPAVELSASVDSTDITTEESLTGQISANSGDRDVTVELFDSDGNSVTTQSITLDSAGDGTFDLGTQNTDTYSIEITDIQTGVTTSTNDTTVTAAPVEPATFEVSELSPKDVTVTTGTAIDISATISNTGGQEATQTVEFRAGGTTLADQPVTLGADSSETVTFEGIDTKSLEANQYDHGIFTDDDSQTATLTIEAEETATPTETPTRQKRKRQHRHRRRQKRQRQHRHRRRRKQKRQHRRRLRPRSRRKRQCRRRCRQRQRHQLRAIARPGSECF
ncbi:MAG: hypothetical protein A07HR60_02857 [uncultured archaeon A07HR60]|nr:MAG: hypothetical protein A07HR60_02857 [uncultured archaeon A07HR60]